jgi:hypothetical protein
MSENTHELHGINGDGGGTDYMFLVMVLVR